MTSEQIKLLSKIKKLIKSGHKKFVNRKDKDHVKELAKIGIDEETAWQEVLGLSSYNYIPDMKPFYFGTGALTFKKCINGYLVYIKLKIEVYVNNEMAVCVSFHIDNM